LGVITAVLMPFALAGCTPAGKPLAAVGRGPHGLPSVLLHFCAGSAPEGIVFFNSTSNDDEEHGNWEVRGAGWPKAEHELEVFEVPPSWTIEQDTLHLGDGRFAVVAYMGHPGPLSVAFTLAEVADLDDDEVLMPTERHGRTLTKDEFHEQAAAEC
jgi:hypothetical protein